jgi:tripartite-type tricarboxylate transporter receptor subunit TctC
MKTTLEVTLAFFIGAGSITAAVPSAAQSYPTKPIRLIVSFAPGGQGDILARTLGPKVVETFRQSVLVDNRPGGGGTIAYETLVRANPDGYTMILAASGYATSAALYKLSYDPMNDVTPIALIGESGFVVALQPSTPVTSVKELIAYDKANPGKLNYGSSGTGGATHLATELFNQMAGSRITHVPYKGMILALNDLLGGQIQVIFGNLSNVIPQTKSNRVRAIAMTTAKRSSALPDIPTVAETVPGYEAELWYAVLGPKGLPRDIVARWNSEINRILLLPDVKERMAGDGLEPVGGSPQRFHEVLKRDIAKWQKVVKIAGIKVGS